MKHFGIVEVVLADLVGTAAGNSGFGGSDLGRHVVARPFRLAAHLLLYVLNEFT